MSRSPCLTTIAATVLAGFALVAFILIGPGSALAGEPAEWAIRVSREPLEPRLQLDAADEVATLAAVQTTLSEVADGSTYVWYRANGRLSGEFRPTASFRDTAGKVCRHLTITLTAGDFTRGTEGIACRRPDGIWSLEG